MSGKDTYKELLKAAKARPWCADTTRRFFAEYEKRQEHGQEEVQAYAQLKCLSEGFEPRWLNEQAGISLDRDENFMALVCLLESLRLDPHQQDVFELCESLSVYAKPPFPAELRPEGCKVSVIMSTYLRPVEIKESIQSVLNQSMGDLELIVVNDGGGDVMRTVITAFSDARIKYIELPEKNGLSTATNTAIAQARGRYITYLDDDDVYYPEHLQVLVDTMESNKQRVIYVNTLGMKGRQVDEKFQPIEESFLWDQAFNRDLLVDKLLMGTAAVIHERDLFRQTGMYREKLWMAEDWDLWLRMAKVCDFLHLNKTTWEYRLRIENVTVRDKSSGHFFGRLVSGYYKYGEGKLAYAKHYLACDNRAKALEVYSYLRSNYEDYFRAAGYVRELIELSSQLGDNGFMMKLSGDLFSRDVRSCAKDIVSNKSLPMLIGAIPAVPKKLWNKLWPQERRLATV